MSVLNCHGSAGPSGTGGILLPVGDSRTNLWICSYDFGLFQLTPGGDLRRWTDQGLDHLSIRVVFEDREENLWIGSNGGGLTRLSLRRFLTVNHDSPVPRQLTRAVAPARQGGVWVAVYDAGLFHSDSSETRRIPVPGPDNASAYGLTVLEDRSGRLWYGDQDACWLRSGRNGFERVPLQSATDANVNALFQDSRDRIWIATREGPVVYEEDQFRPLGPESTA